MVKRGLRVINTALPAYDLTCSTNALMAARFFSFCFSSTAKNPSETSSGFLSKTPNSSTLSFS